ncbi:hypothetical protein SCAR479_11038 [Seiridium cardinale]|uniref:Uncharacterized protein n=1 Tax=Seiridium cardinale TaxID=138064 RepID=A0ABR2XEW7_9PEZI
MPPKSPRGAFSPLSRSFFTVLPYIAGLLLWGPTLYNGTFKALLEAPLTGQLNQYTQLRTNYTGIFVLDYFIGVMVAFFYPATSAQDEGYQLFVLDAYSTFACGFVWLHTEASRPGPKPKWITRVATLGWLWQAFGAAIILPIFYAIHIPWASQKTLPRVIDVNRARALTPALLLGVAAPTAFIMAPAWMGPNYRLADEHQIYVAIFMLSPIWVAGILEATTLAGASLRSVATTRTNRSAAAWWVRAAYLQTCAISAVGHLYPTYKLLVAENPEIVNLTRMYVPAPFEGPSGVEDILVIGSWLFLQYDHIIISLSSLSWALVLLRKTPLDRIPTIVMILLLLVGSVVLGPGATVSLALYLREGHLSADKKS